MSLIPKLGIQLLCADGEPIVATIPQYNGTVRVRVVCATTIPIRKGRFMDAIVDGNFNDKIQLPLSQTVYLFGSETLQLQPLPPLSP